MEEAWEAPFNQEGPPPLLGEASLFRLTSTHGGSAPRSRRLSDAARAGVHFCIRARGCKKRRGGDLLFSSRRSSDREIRTTGCNMHQMGYVRIGSAWTARTREGRLELIP